VMIDLYPGQTLLWSADGEIVARVNDEDLRDFSYAISWNAP
jgi:hypothetical protein